MSLPNTKPLIFNTQTTNDCKVGINKNTAPTATLDVNGIGRFSTHITTPEIRNLFGGNGHLKFQNDTSRIYNRDINNTSFNEYEFIEGFVIRGDTTVNNDSTLSTDLQEDNTNTSKIVNTNEEQECLFRVGTIKTNAANPGTRGEIISSGRLDVYSGGKTEILSNGYYTVDTKGDGSNINLTTQSINSNIELKTLSTNSVIRLETVNNDSNIVLDSSRRVNLLAPNNQIRLETGTTIKLLADNSIDANQSITVTSDDRLKFNEIPIENALSIIDSLNPMIYDKVKKLGETPDTGTTRKEVGLIAQEVEQIPELIHAVNRNDNDDEDEDDIYYLNYNQIFNYNLAATKELHNIIKQQALMIQNLTQRIEALENS